MKENWTSTQHTGDAVAKPAKQNTVQLTVDTPICSQQCRVPYLLAQDKEKVCQTSTAVPSELCFEAD
jgi:hypothetical protein